MRVEARKLASGEHYFSFVYWDGERRVRLKKDECPYFVSREKANGQRLKKLRSIQLRAGSSEGFNGKLNITNSQNCLTTTLTTVRRLSRTHGRILDSISKIM